MRKILFTIIILSALGMPVYAQQAAAILAKEPANNAVELNANAEATASLGEDGLTNMLLTLKPNGTADNTHIYDAINGFSYYITQTGKEQWRAMAVKSYTTALSKITDKYNQAFIISQLQIIGKDDAVPALKTYLQDDKLCDPAARALVKVNTPNSKQALREVLTASKDSCRLSIVEALGDSKDDMAAESIGALIGKDKKLDKVSLYALSQIASPDSYDKMVSAARASGYNFDETNATSSFIAYLNNLSARGTMNKLRAAHYSKNLYDETIAAAQVHTHIAAMRLIANLMGGPGTTTLIDAVKGGNPQCRAAALEIAGPRLESQGASVWIRQLGKKDITPDAKAAIITMLGNNHAQEALPSALTGLKDPDKVVVLASIKASQQIGQSQALNDLLAILKTGDADEITAVQNALLVMKGPGVVDKVAKDLPDAPAKAQAALLVVLSERRAHNKIDIVMPLLNSNDTTTTSAAFTSLKYLAGPENLPALFSWLNKVSDPSATANLQAAIIAVIGQTTDPKSQSAMVLQQMSNASADKKPLYFNILASIGDKASLDAVSKAYDNGDKDTKRSAVTALSQWADGSAVRELLHIGQSAGDGGLQNRIIHGAVELIGKSNYPAEEKVIFLREAMDIARNTDQQNLVLDEIANDKTYDALIFAGKYIDDPKLQTSASAAVVSIALSSKDFYGDDVRAIFAKVMAMHRGGDGDYEREAIKKFVAEMPSDKGYIDLFNNKDLAGWKGLVGNPITRSKMDAATLSKEQQKADSIMRKGWYVKDSVLNFSGDGDNICTIKQYRNFDMYVDWKIESKGDAGIYLRGSPQVQIWDTSRVDVGAQVGSGGLYNNQAHESKPLKLADNAIGEWNTFHIIMKDDKVTVYFNGVLVVDNVVLDNYWDRKLPIFPKEQIELQAHGTHVYYRDVYLKELPD